MICRSRGFGLIELMISLLVSVIIMSGLYGLLTSSVVNFGFSKASSDAVDTGHRVDNFLNNILFQSGFINYNRLINGEGLAAAQSDLAVPGFGQWAQDQFIYSSTSGQVLIRYYGSSVVDDTDNFHAIGQEATNGFITDCAGNAVGRDTLVTASIHVDGSGLVCDYIDNTGSTGNQTQVVIDPTVRSLMFEFGSSFDPAFAAASVNGFLSSQEILDNGLNWGHVDTVRYSIITSQPSNQRLISSNAVLHHFNGTDDIYVYQIPVADQSNVHRVITGTVYLVNVQKN